MVVISRVEFSIQIFINLDRQQLLFAQDVA